MSVWRETRSVLLEVPVGLFSEKAARSLPISASPT